jgi:hypothetical protein
MTESPKDGTPIIAVCGGVECAVIWDGDSVLGEGWFHFDEDEGGNTYQRVKGEPSEWRKLFG